MEQLQFIEKVTQHLSTLVESGALQGWSLQATVSRRHQRLYASPDGTALTCHQSRRVTEKNFSLSIYSPVEGEGLVGTAMIDLVPYRPIDQQLTEAIELSHTSRNIAWRLAGVPGTEPEPVNTCDREVRDTPESVMASIEDQFTQAFSATSGCRLNSAELFLNYSIRTQINSEGLTYETEQSELYLESAMEKVGQENDKEVYEHITSVISADLNVKSFIEDCALQASVLGDSEEPETSNSATILINKDALAQMLSAVLQQLNCSNEYSNLPFLTPNDAFGGGEGDALTLHLDPSIPCMVLSRAYTRDGLPATRGLLIENNKVKNRVIDNRFGQYLSIEPNGISGNLMVQPGSLTKESLKGTDYIEVIKFSSLLIDDRKLTWSSEIKLGRHIATDGRITLIKGGVVSGNLKENFTNCRLSATHGTVNIPPSSYDPALGYQGPDAMLITRGISISGQTKGEV